MYFFRIEISSFDDAAKTLFVIPEQNADEQGVPFEEKILTQTAEYKSFIKENATSMVDGVYTQYKCADRLESVTEETFVQLQAEGKLEQLDSNSFSVSTGFKPKKSGGKKDMKAYLIIGAAALVLVVMMIVSSAAGSKGGEVTTSVESSESTESSVPESSEDSTSTSSDESSSEISTSSSEPVFIDDPPEETSEPSDAANENGYTDTGYTKAPTTSSSGNIGGVYSIYFNANGGEGTLESISSEAGQYVSLPRADMAAKSLTKKGYKLIGFSDNTEIPYPLYEYKMPYNDVTLFAVWEPDRYTVNYNSNGGTGTLSRAEVRYGSEVPLPTDISVYKDGLFLSGWAETANAKSALKSLKMPAEDITLYAVWADEAPTASITLHYDDKIQVIEKKIGSTVNMLDSFGVWKDGYSVEGWYFENSPTRVENLYVDADCDLYAKWQTAEYITVTVDRSYLGKDAETYRVPLDMTGAATLKLPRIDDKSDTYSHVDGCTYGYSDRKQTGEFGTIKYFGDTEYKFTENTTLYRVLNEYGGGTGTRENPYIISYYDQLIRLSEKKASGHFVQTADIKFPANIERKPIDTKEISRGYENKSYDFFVYDGGNFKIKNLRGKGGLFGKIAGSTIKNVNIEDADISAADYSNVGLICNEIASYSFGSIDGARDYATGNSKIINCSVRKSKIDGGSAKNIGGICGYGGVISDCLANEIAINGGENVGGIVGNACSVTGCLANGVTADGGIKSAGGIAGTAYGTRIYDNGGEYCYSDGNIIGCGVRTFVSTAENSGGIIGTATSDAKSAYIKSCYVANIYLNGRNNGGVAGADGEKEPHRIAYCLIDSANGYPVICGENVRSISKTMVLSVPGGSGLTVEGVLSVLNAPGSGYNQWLIDKNVNDGYPYTKAVSSGR